MKIIAIILAIYSLSLNVILFTYLIKSEHVVKNKKSKNNIVKPLESNAWVENEIELIRKKYKGDKWALSKCEKAYEIYQELRVFTNSDHFDIDVIIHLLSRFAKFSPIVPILDDKDEWIKTYESDAYDEYTSKRCGYFQKFVNDDRTITYTDNARCTECINTSPTSWSRSFADNITTVVIDQLDPIFVPYKPGTRDWTVYTNCIKNICDDHIDTNIIKLKHILRAEDDCGTRILIDRYFMLVPKRNEDIDLSITRKITIRKDGTITFYYRGYEWQELTKEEYSDLMNRFGYTEVTC